MLDDIVVFIIQYYLGVTPIWALKPVWALTPVWA
jgi:hypothetical protein